MNTRALEDISEKLCRELDEIAKKPELGAGDLDIVHKLTGTMKNIYKIEMYEEDGGYSRTDARERMRSQMEDMMRDADDDRTREAIRRCMNELDS